MCNCATRWYKVVNEMLVYEMSAIFRRVSQNSNTYFMLVRTSLCVCYVNVYQDLNFINPASTDVMIFITPTSTVFFHQSRFKFKAIFINPASTYTVFLSTPRQLLLRSFINSAATYTTIFSAIPLPFTR